VIILSVIDLNMPLPLSLAPSEKINLGCSECKHQTGFRAIGVNGPPEGG